MANILEPYVSKYLKNYQRKKYRAVFARLFI